MCKVLLSTAYFPPILYFLKILHASEIIIEKEENFLKQTFRSRCVILGANGPLNLTVPVIHNEPKTKISNVKISYHSNWQLIHLRAIESAYRNSPFYEYYIDDIQRFFQNKFENLLEYNTEILKEFLVLLKYKGSVKFTDTFIKEKDEFDFRYSISPKETINGFEFAQYHQVFIEKFGFIPNLSILDLIFNLGPESSDYLENL